MGVMCDCGKYMTLFHLLLLRDFHDEGKQLLTHCQPDLGHPGKQNERLSTRSRGRMVV
jgi:hypothetical protein